MLTIAEVLEYLGLPVRLPSGEMKEQVKAYLASLTTEEKKALVVEDGPKATYASEVEFLRQVGFTPIEASWYAGTGLDDPRVRNLVARRTLALKRSGKPCSSTAYDLMRMEHDVLKGLTNEQVMKELRNE